MKDNDLTIRCPNCKEKINLQKYTNISYKNTSNSDIIYSLGYTYGYDKGYQDGYKNRKRLIKKAKKTKK